MEATEHSRLKVTLKQVKKYMLWMILCFKLLQYVDRVVVYEGRISKAHRIAWISPLHSSDILKHKHLRSVEDPDLLQANRIQVSAVTNTEYTVLLPTRDQPK